MGDGFFFWYREGWNAGDADRIIRYLEGCGLRITKSGYWQHINDHQRSGELG